VLFSETEEALGNKESADQMLTVFGWFCCVHVRQFIAL
jgi:hypothetical protein